MPPRHKNKNSSASAGGEAAGAAERDSKRLRPTAAAHAAGGGDEEGAAGTSAAATATTAGAVSPAGAPANASAPVSTRPSHQQQQQHRHHHHLQRSLDVLLIVVERQRQAAREERIVKRRALALKAETSAGPPFETEWVDDGADDDDGEGGALAGGGWRAKARDAPDSKPSSSSDNKNGDDKVGDDKKDDDGNSSDGNEESRDEVFVRTLVAASRVCRSWRAVCFRSADRASIDIAGVPGLGAYAGGVLHALRVRGPFPSGRALRAFSRALAHAAESPSLISAVRGVRLLYVDHVSGLMDALPARVIASPPLFSSLASLELDDMPCFWQRREPGRLFSRLALPALRVLSVSLDRNSDCPLSLPHGGGASGNDSAFLPPFLTRLRLESKRYAPPESSKWPRHAPLLIALPSLASLAPSLRSLKVGQPFVVPYHPLEQDDNDGDDDDGAPRKASIFEDSQWKWVSRTQNAPLPSEIAPCQRLHAGLSPLTGLTSLFLESECDWNPAHVSGHNEDRAQLDQVRFPPEKAKAVRDNLRARRNDWEAGARSLFLPMSAMLRRLEISARIDFAQAVELPSCMSALTALTALTCRCFRFDRVGPGLKTLTSLRFLEIDVTRSEHDYGYFSRGPFLRAADLAPLTALEDLTLTMAPSAVAPAIASALTSLTSITLSDAPGERVPWEYEDDAPPVPDPPLPLRVALAVRRRWQSTSLVVWILGEPAESGRRMRKINADEMGQLILERGGSFEDDEDEDFDDDEDDDEDTGLWYMK